MTNATNTLEFKAYRDMDKKDGIDHIRIDKHAITLLGKQLIPSYTRTFLPSSLWFICQYSICN